MKKKPKRHTVKLFTLRSSRLSHRLSKVYEELEAVISKAKGGTSPSMDKRIRNKLKQLGKEIAGLEREVRDLRRIRLNEKKKGNN